MHRQSLRSASSESSGDWTLMSRLRPRASAARLRFWRPFSRTVLDLVCGEGVVARLPLHTYEALRVILPLSRFDVIDGKGQATTLHPGRVYRVAPLQLRAVQSQDGAPCAMRVLLVAPGLLAILCAERSGSPSAVAPLVRSGVVEDPELYARLCALVDGMRGPLVDLECAARMRECLLHLLGRSAEARSTQPSSTGRQPVGIVRVRDHLREHVVDSVSLSELAGVAGLSKFYLLRAFNRVHGVTPHAYQMRLRLARAWRLITDGVSLSRTAYDAGFADQSHLTRRFADVFGVTPGRYAWDLAELPGSLSNGSMDAVRRVAPSTAA
jgi:AraC-like DNA-binding protein